MSEPALPTLTAYRLPDVSPAGTADGDFMTALLTALSSATDYRDEAIPATHLWDYTAELDEAIAVLPPTGHAMTVNPGIIFAAAGAQGSAAMLSPDLFSATFPWVGIGKNVGAYGSWDTAAPWTSGYWPGFWMLAGSGMFAATAVIRPYVTQESIILDFWTSATAHFAVIIGATVAAHNDHASAREADGRLYGLFTCGGSALTSTFLTASSGVLNHGSGASAAHGMVMQPGASAIYTCGRSIALQAAPVTGNDLDYASVPILTPITIAQSTATNTQAGKPIGRLREVYMCHGAMQAGLTYTNALGDDELHFIGYNSGAAGQCLAIKAAP